MMTRQELVVEFMKALASNPAMTPTDTNDKQKAREIFLLSAELADKVLEFN